MSGEAPERSAAGLDLATTIGLAIFSFVAALGFGRVFGGWPFVEDALVIVVVGHGMSFAARRLRLPGVFAVPATTIALAWVTAWLYYPSTFSTVFPTPQTWDTVWADVGLVREQFPDAVAPVAYLGGWAALAGLGTALVVVLSDAFAFRAHGRGEALVPGAVLFVFVAALGIDRHRVALTLGLVAAGFLATALLRARFARAPRTVLGPSRHPLVTTLPAVAMAGTVVVLGAWAIGPRLPGAGEEAWVDTQGRSGGVTQVVSPLVDIRARLVNRSDEELFVVEAAAESNWRVSALPSFNGNEWGLPSRSLVPADGDLTGGRPGAVDNRQVLTVTALGGRFVPAAADPVAADGDGLRFNEETSTLVRIDRTLESGDEFEILSAMPVFMPEELRGASSSAPPDPIYLELPERFPSVVAETAASVTEGSATTYDAMRTLQDWFRGNFEYSLEVPSGHGTSAIEAFLRQRVGYCEQFAGTFAAMARSLGIPARVAVGFTPGLVQPDGTYSVLGKNAHAWPEVWFDGFGWVPFEPTPGRGAPSGENYTGVAPQQDDAPVGGAGAGEPAAVDDDVTSPPATGVADPANDVFDPGLVIDDQPAGAAPAPVEESSGRSWGRWLLALAAVGVVMAVPPLVRSVRRRRTHLDTADQVVELWHRAMRAVESAGVHLDPALTPAEQARAASPRIPVAGQPLRALADAATAAAYASPEQLEDLHLATDDPARGPLRWCHQVEEVAIDSLTSGGRARRYFTVWH